MSDNKRITERIFVNEYKDNEIIVEFDGEEVFRWHDNAQTDYPEDLCWHRIISEVFYSGVKLGKKLGEVENDRAK